MTFYQVWLDNIQTPEFVGMLAFAWITLTGIIILATIRIIRIFKPQPLYHIPTQHKTQGDKYYANANRKP